MKIRLKVEDKVITATLNDSKTARDFVSLLPLTLTMNDLFRREKFAHLPRPISEEGKRTHTYEVGQVVYWSPGPDVAIFYRNDGEKIPHPGIIVIGKIDSGVAALDVTGFMEAETRLAIEVAKIRRLVWRGWPMVKNFDFQKLTGSNEVSGDFDVCPDGVQRSVLSAPI
jgi:hypothetical protein